ncbi:MAG TPA: response regulator transcription factor [Acidobacteria bacterium]|nr:response regulator transcription factor [Acidobacteriota bacterium]
MSGERILLIEDDVDLAASLKLALGREGYRVRHEVTGAAGLAAALDAPPDLLLLDLNLPDMDGLAICRELRGARAVRDLPIIMLTARSLEGDRVRGLDVGADDYVTKPFSLAELRSRINAQLRRRQLDQGTPDDVYRDGRLEVRRNEMEVRRDGEPVRVTGREMELLWFLIAARPRVVPREVILERVWGLSSDVTTRTIDVHVRSLRKKLGREVIETVIGRGYRFRGFPAP